MGKQRPGQAGGQRPQGRERSGVTSEASAEFTPGGQTRLRGRRAAWPPREHSPRGHHANSRTDREITTRTLLQPTCSEPRGCPPPRLVRLSSHAAVGCSLDATPAHPPEACGPGGASFRGPCPSGAAARGPGPCPLRGTAALVRQKPRERRLPLRAVEKGDGTGGTLVPPDASQTPRGVPRVSGSPALLGMSTSGWVRETWTPGPTRHQKPQPGDGSGTGTETASLVVPGQPAPGLTPRPHAPVPSRSPGSVSHPLSPRTTRGPSL